MEDRFATGDGSKSPTRTGDSQLSSPRVEVRPALKVARSGVKGRFQCSRCRAAKHGWLVLSNPSGVMF